MKILKRIKKKHNYPDCRITEENAAGEIGADDTIWNLNNFKGGSLLLRNKDEIFRIFIHFPDQFIKDYHLDYSGEIPLLYFGEWITKKYYKKKLIFTADNSYIGKRSFERNKK